MEDHHYLIRGGLEGRERLRVLGRVMQPNTLALLQRAGVGPGLRCLDVGCGGGDVTRDLSRMVDGSGSVVGIDVDATKIDLARSESGDATNVEFRVGDVTAGLGSEEYDVVYTRFVLTHLRDPAALVAHMRAALRPGGRLIVEDIDYRGSFCEPEREEFERYEEIYVETARRNGGDPDIGLRLPRMLVDAGFDHVRPQVVQPAGLEGESKLLPALTLENIRAMAVKHDVATADEIDRLVDVLYDVARDPTTYVGNPRIVQVWGDRGQGPS
jgi:SAM-dependent methyltransferase